MFNTVRPIIRTMEVVKISHPVAWRLIPVQTCWREVCCLYLGVWKVWWNPGRATGEWLYCWEFSTSCVTSSPTTALKARTDITTHRQGNINDFLENFFFKKKKIEIIDGNYLLGEVWVDRAGDVDLLVWLQTGIHAQSVDTRTNHDQLDVPLRQHDCHHCLPPLGYR